MVTTTHATGDALLRAARAGVLARCDARRPLLVRCDRCARCPLDEAFSLGDVDVCPRCRAELVSQGAPHHPPSREPQHATRMMQDALRTPPSKEATLMMQDALRPPRPSAEEPQPHEQAQWDSLSTADWKAPPVAQPQWPPRA